MRFTSKTLVVAGLLATLTRTRGRAADRLFAFAFAWGRAPLPSPRPAVTTVSPTAARGPLEYGRTS